MHIICVLIRTGLTYDPFNSSVVHIGNNVKCNVAGVGTIKIKTHNGVIRSLSNVRHVPNLKCNLISLSTLESKGCKYSTEGGVLKVSKGSRTVLKGLRYGSLYILQGSTMTGSHIIPTSIPNDIFTYLYHTWLDYMREKKWCHSSSIAKFKHPLNLRGTHLA